MIITPTPTPNSFYIPLTSLARAHYDRTKVDFHSKKYSKLDFSVGGVSGRERDKLIDLGELERHFEEGWLFVSARQVV